MHCDLRAASRAACTAGKSRLIKTPIIAITTNNSTSVNPLDKQLLLFFTAIRLLEGASKNASDPKPATFITKLLGFYGSTTTLPPGIHIKDSRKQLKVSTAPSTIRIKMPENLSKFQNKSRNKKSFTI
jgi:hypothetical protein